MIKNITALILLLFLISSCHMGRHYANYRHGGKTEASSDSHAEESVLENIDYSLPISEISIPEKTDNQDAFELEPEHPVNYISAMPQENKTQPSYSRIPEDSTAYSIYPEEPLLSAISSAGMNAIAGVLGALTLSFPNFIWISAPMYIIAVPVFTVITVICIIAALIKYKNGNIAKENKEYFWIWLLLFIVGTALIVGTLLVFL